MGRRTRLKIAVARIGYIDLSIAILSVQHNGVTAVGIIEEKDIFLSEEGVTKEK